MELVIRRTMLEEIEDILQVQKSAFQETLEKYNDYETSPATEVIERLMYKIMHYHHYTIILEGEIVGGAEVRLKSDTHCYLNRIFITPVQQGKGLGRKVMEYLEGLYPQVKNWTLNTPHKEYRNHYLYEQLGYVKVEEEIIGENLILFHYLKEK